LQRDDAQLDVRRVVRAADILWTYIRVGYRPDVLRCLAIVEELIRFEPHEATLVGEREAIPEEGFAEGAAGEVMDDLGQENWANGLEQVLSLGRDVAYLPLVNLSRIARDDRFFDNNDYTSANVDALTHRVSFRWYRHELQTGSLYARVLVRGLNLSGHDLRDALRGLDGFLWRTPLAGDADEVHAQGTFGPSDVRLVGSSRRILEFAAAAASASDALAVLGRVADAIAAVAPDLPGDDVGGVVRTLLATDALSTTRPQPDFWYLRPSAPQPSQ
jgi:hypothetical protein